MKTIIVVTGGRNYNDQATAFQALDDIPGNIALLVHGACRRKGQLDLCGADKLADDWATLTEVPCLRVPAAWRSEGLSAGPNRNTRMLRQAEFLARQASAHLVLVAFPGGRGTADCVAKAEQMNMEIVEIGLKR